MSCSAWTERRTGITEDGETWRKLIVAFRNFAKAPKKGEGFSVATNFDSSYHTEVWHAGRLLLALYLKLETLYTARSLHAFHSSCKIKGHSWHGTVQNNNCYGGVLWWAEDEQYTVWLGNVTNLSGRNRTPQILQSERHLYFLPIWELTGFNSRAQRPDALTMFFRSLLQSIQINAGIMTHCNIRPISVKHIFSSSISNFSKFLARDTDRLIK